MTDPTDQTTPDTATEALTVPPAIEAVIQHFDALDKSFTEFDVSRDLNVARAALNEPTDADNAGAWAEVLAFALSQGPDHVNPWNTYFGPMASQTYEDGRVLYSPDILGAPKELVDHWAQRARSVSHPILKARYADLAWDMSQAIGQRKRDPEDARLAIDAYLHESSFRVSWS
jgi:lysyl-tRNA synthetase class 1